MIISESLTLGVEAIEILYIQALVDDINKDGE